MKNLQHYTTKWNLVNPKTIADTPTSTVYKAHRRDSDVVLKLLSPLGRISEAKGAIALRHFAGHGAVKLLEADEGAHLVSFVEGPFLKELSSRGQDAKATEIICDVFGKLHRSRGGLPDGLPTMEENFRSLYKYAKQNGDDELILRAVKVADHLLATEQERIVLHGDIHHKNIMETSDGEWLAIDPKGLIGERAYDFANVFYNPDDSPTLVERTERIEEVCGMFARRFEIEPVRILEYAFAYGCLSACWAMEDDMKSDRRLRIARCICSLIEN